MGDVSVLSLATGKPPARINEPAVAMLEETLARVRSGQVIGIAIAELNVDGMGKSQWHVLDQGNMALSILTLSHQYAHAALTGELL